MVEGSESWCLPGAWSGLASDPNNPNRKTASIQGKCERKGRPDKGRAEGVVGNRRKVSDGHAYAL